MTCTATEGGILSHGVWVDIFVCDNAPNGVFKQYLHKYTLKWLKSGYNSLLNVGLSRSPFLWAVRYLVTLPLRCMGQNSVKKMIKAEMIRYNSMNTQFIVDTGSPDYWRNLFRSSVFMETIDVEYEGYYLSTVKEYHEVLSTTYGDYMIPPPEDQRCGHDLNRVDCGKYDNIEIILAEIHKLYGYR